MWLSKLSTHLSAPRQQLRYAGLHSTRTLQYLTQTSIESLAISERSKRVLTKQMNYEFLTHVQNETMPHILAGKDVLAKGKTGNGKTIAFLLPTIENLLKARESNGSSANNRGSGAKISTLVISPTRELASQIAVEAEKLTAAHGMRTACLVGGTSMNSDVKQLTHASGLDVLVATPGRLQAHLDDNSGNIRQKLSDLRVLVLDEADRLLDMGFRREIMKIISNLPAQRQTLLFSATLPESTEELKDVALRADYAFVDTIHEDDHQTNVQTVQEFVTCDLPNVIPVVENILTEHMQEPAYKVLVFLPTARAAQFMAQLFVKAKFPNVLEMHSRKSQSARTKAADAFRSGKKVIMFSSDVSARGVDYPDVSLVLQIGLTDRDQYIHRLGRTARAGMEGRGVLVLADFEKPFLKDLADLPLTEKHVALTSPKGFRTTDALARLKPESELEKSAQQSYQAFLGFYNSNQKKLGLDKEALVELAEHYSHVIGLSETPRLDKKILRKMGLFGVKGLEPAAHAERAKFAVKSSRSSGGSRGGRESSGERASSGRRTTPRNFGESAATPASERFDLSDLESPVRYERASRSASEPPRERRGRAEQFGSGRERHSDRDGERPQQFGGRPRRDEPARGRSAPRFDAERRGARFSERDARSSGGDSGRGARRAPRESNVGERSEWHASKSASPAREHFGSHEDRGRGGRARSEERPHTTSHRRNRGEQRARERSDRFSKRF